MDSSENHHGRVSIISDGEYGAHFNKGVDLDVLEKQMNTYGEAVSPAARGVGEVDQDEVVSDGGWGVRHVFGLLSFSALAVSYMTRNSINIAIVAMVALNASYVSGQTDVCPLRSLSNETSDNTPTGEFDWDEETRGMILGCFFYGYLVGNLLGGFASAYLGGRVTLGVSVLFVSIISLLSPVCIRTSSTLYMGLRIVCGIFQALKVPWKDIATSMPFLSQIVYVFGDAIGFYTIMTEIPTYLNNIQHFDLASNGILSGLPYVCVLMTSPLFGSIANKICEKKWLSMKMTRKLATGVGLYSSCICLIAMCFVDCNTTLVVVFLCLAVSVNGAKYSGASVAEQDIAPNFAGVLKGITSSVNSTAGFIVPMVVGVITSGNQTLSAWRIVFGISAVTYFIGGSAYLMFGTDKAQPWNEPKRK